MKRRTHDPSRAEPEIETVVFFEAARFGILLGGVFSIFNFLLINKVFGIFIGIIGIVLCALYRYPVIKNIFKRLEENPPSFEGEEIIMEGYATHHRSFEGLCPGYMCLTDKQLHFWYYPFADTDWENHILLRNVDRIETFKRYFIFPTGLRLIMANGKKEIITVQKWRDGWLEEIYKVWIVQSRLGPEAGFGDTVDNR